MLVTGIFWLWMKMSRVRKYSTNCRFGSNFEFLPTRCRGILIDGDLAKHIDNQRVPEPGESISGTLPFMSMNLLIRLVEGTRVYHNPNDDLESGAWVAMVCGLEHSVQYSPTKRERSWLAGLLSHHVATVSQTKLTISSYPPPMDHPFYGLIVKWLRLFAKRAEEDRFGAKGTVSTETYITSYQEFLREGFTWLKTYGADLHKSWRDLFLSQTIKEYWE
ncbi:hypothetical protein BS47DRAFT_602867 [Hydnum rufescens UP504]|uniref:Fungal-type protein kinase domain-containing protein n=1 Tax=Hydnum rufescens UP504 TaxID=1448309 RepID=A0A9P6B3L8_9AGAM|nr:hypothetical protein BS47DRAFT_602867 [Hydnum rufescens UP504]